MTISFQHLTIIGKYYIKMQREFAYTQARLIARQYILQDLYMAHLATVNMHKLIIHNARQVTYDLRPTVIPKNHYMHALSLYRDDGTTRAEALVEGILDWRIAQYNHEITISILFKDGNNLEIHTCLPNV